MRPTFPYSKLSSSSNFSSLQELAIDAKFISMEFLSSFNILGFLNQLQLTADFGRTNRCEVGLVGAVGRVIAAVAAELRCCRCRQRHQEEEDQDEHHARFCIDPLEKM
jgi:hypothetical protein